MSKETELQRLLEEADRLQQQSRHQLASATEAHLQEWREITQTTYYRKPQVSTQSVPPASPASGNKTAQWVTIVSLIASSVVGAIIKHYQDGPEPAPVAVPSKAPPAALPSSGAP